MNEDRFSLMGAVWRIGVLWLATIVPIGIIGGLVALMDSANAGTTNEPGEVFAAFVVVGMCCTFAVLALAVVCAVVKQVLKP